MNKCKCPSCNCETNKLCKDCGNCKDCCTCKDESGNQCCNCPHHGQCK